jgi:uncharacterized protein (DUF2132 family)
MSLLHPNDPLHGITLEGMLVRLVECYGWVDMAQVLKIRCLAVDPTIKSCLTFLRKTPWARKKVEALYVRSLRDRPSGS